MQAQEEKQFLNQVQIDQEWIFSKDQLIIDPDLLMCPVCYGVPLQQYAQCIKCGRIFCQKDFKQVQSTLDSCPNCKNSPFEKKSKPHILYKSIFERLVFQCKLCQEQNQHLSYKIHEGQKGQNLHEKSLQSIKKYTKQQLSDHINVQHKKKVMDFNVLYDFEVIFQKGDQTIVFDMYQNIQLNQNYQKSMQSKDKNYPYQLDSGDYLIINFSENVVSSPTLMKAGKLLKKPSQSLKKNIDYEVWSVMLDLDFKIYSLKYQELIIKEHEEFLKNHRKNQFILDVGNQRYRISFTKMSQINTYTGFERPIQKKIVKFI